MQMTLENRGSECELLMQGRLDSYTAPDAEKIFQELPTRFDFVILNLSGLEMLSSAGLRILKLLHMAMQKKGGRLMLRCVPRNVMEVFEMTGYVGLLDLE